MFNIQLDLKNAGELFKTPIGAAFVILFAGLLFMYIGMIMASTSKEDVCKEELKLIIIQKDQIEYIEEEYSKAIAAGETSCIEREQRLCRSDKEELKKNCNDLLDSLLPNSGARLE